MLDRSVRSPLYHYPPLTNPRLSLLEDFYRIRSFRYLLFLPLLFRRSLDNCPPRELRALPTPRQPRANPTPSHANPGLMVLDRSRLHETLIFLKNERFAWAPATFSCLGLAWGSLEIARTSSEATPKSVSMNFATFL